MKSFCIKTNNKKIISTLLKDLENSNFENIFFTNKQFKNYENIIIHYKGNNFSEFINLISDILSDCIIFYYESNLLQRIINYNYFYFDELDKRIIEEYCYKTITDNEESNYKFRRNEIWIEVMNYINNNKSMILDGFVNFRLKHYLNTLDEIVDSSVKQYVIEKEYNEFISLLQMYINSKQSSCNLLHLIYINGESIILDESKNIIDLEDDIFDAKYISDISFSSNDYSLNALLTLLPKKIELHLIGPKDDFIDSLELIFGHRLSICTDCNICQTYRILNNNLNFKNKK